MMENNNSPTHLSLYQLNNLVSEVISLSFNQDFWVEAEISEIREVRGHCYIELIEKRRKDEHSHCKSIGKVLEQQVDVYQTTFRTGYKTTAKSRHEGAP